MESVSSSLWNDLIGYLQQGTDLSASGFEPLDAGGGDNHGGWLWTCIRHDESGFLRVASLGLTEDGAAKPALNVEVTAGAEHDAATYSERVATYGLSEAAQLWELAETRLVRDFKLAMQRAAELDLQDLRKRPPPLRRLA